MIDSVTPRTDVGPEGERPAIPLVDGDAVALVAACPDRVADLIGSARRHYTGLVLRLGDWAARRWLTRTVNPYREEIDAVARRVGVPGGEMLNLSYEWTCTSGVGPQPGGPGMRMLRTLDWPLDGLGRTLVVARRPSPHGSYLNVTWPGYVGVLTAMAPGRFAAAINQPPMRARTPWCWLDWAIDRIAMWRSDSLPPSHLLRRVFDSCRDYDEAKAALCETPVCMPVFYTLAGTTEGAGCVIERLPDRAVVHEAPTSIANHWLGIHRDERPRGTDSRGRLAQMERIRDLAADDLSWLEPPILNPTTRIAAVANAATGYLAVQGLEADGPATATFRTTEPARGETPDTSPARPAEATG